MRLILIGFLVASLSGCGTSAIFSKENMRKWDKGSRKAVLNKAEFDLDCPRKKIKIKVINRAECPQCDGGKGLVTEYGVRGCGSKIRYIEAGGKWIANTASVK